jgi:hypothetical protein
MFLIVVRLCFEDVMEVSFQGNASRADLFDAKARARRSTLFQPTPSRRVFGKAPE